MNKCYFSSVAVGQGLEMKLFSKIQHFFLPENFLSEKRSEEYFQGIVLFWVTFAAFILFIPSFSFQLLSSEVPTLNKALIGVTSLILTIFILGFYYFTRYGQKYFFQFLWWGACALVLVVSTILISFATIARSFNSSAFFLMPLMPITLAYFTKPRFGLYLSFAFVVFVSIFYYYFYTLGNVGDNTIEFWTRGKIHYVDSIAALVLASALAWIYDHSRKQVKDLLKQKEKTITEQQEKLFHSAKFHSLGEMAASLAHEINNPLFVIQGKVHSIRNLLRKDQLDREKCDEVVTSVEETVIRLSRIVRGISSFARSDVRAELVEIRVNDLVKDVIFLSQERMVDYAISCEIVSEDDYVLNCYPAYITQILINLLNNAIDSLHSKQRRKIQVKVFKTTESFHIEVHDNGSGVPVDLDEQIFEAFYTTKAYGKGTGLGLSISRSLAKEHEGKLVLVPSVFEEGAGFSLQIPLSYLSKPS